MPGMDMRNHSPIGQGADGSIDGCLVNLRYLGLGKLGE